MEDGISYEYDTLGNVTSVKKSSWNSASGTELASGPPEVTYTYNNPEDLPQKILLSAVKR